MHREFKKCTALDIGQLAEISKKTFISAFEKDNDPADFKSYVDTAFSKSMLLEQLNNPQSSFYFLYADTVLVGYFKINIGDAQSEVIGPDSMELERIYVLPSFQGQGFGAYMLKQVRLMATKQKKKRLWLGVWQKNTNAVRFYEKHGYEKFGTHPYFIGEDKQTDWLMGIDL